MVTSSVEKPLRPGPHARLAADSRAVHQDVQRCERASASGRWLTWKGAPGPGVGAEDARAGGPLLKLGKPCWPENISASRVKMEVWVIDAHSLGQNSSLGQLT